MNCPNCGATVSESVCPYCGTKLVTFQNKKEQEETYKLEDQYLIQKNGISSKPSLFFILFGGIFFFVGFILFIIFISIDEFREAIFPVLMPFLFMMIGGICLLLPIRSMWKVSKIKQNGVDLTGIVRGYEYTNIMIDNVPVLAVLIRTKEINPCLLRVNTNQINRKYALGQEVNLKKLDDEYLLMK